MQIGLGAVAVATLVPVLLGGLVLVVSAPRSRRAPGVLAWLGLAIGVLTVITPISAQADLGTKVVLASMHLTTGVVWWLALRRQSGQSR